MQKETKKKQECRHEARGHIMEAYTVLLLAVFPFYNTDHFFSLLSDRTGFFQAATWVMAAALLAEEVLHRIRIKKGARRGGIRGCIRQIPSEYAFLATFLLVSAVSTLLSDHQAEAWTGEAGRMQGLFMWLAYGTAFFCISRSFCPGKRHIWLFLASGTIAALWGICDYMGPGLSWWLADVKESQKHMFTSSIGNINTYTAFLAIGFSLSGAYTVFRDMRGKWAEQESTVLLAAFFLFSVALATGRSDNAVIGIAAFFLALPAGIRDTRQASRYLGLLAVFLAAFPAAALLSAHTGNPYMEVPDGILLKAGIRGGVFFFIPSTAAAAAAFCLSRGEKPLCRFRRVWPALLAVSGVFFIMVFLDANLFPDTGRYGAARAYLEFNDDWGTYRGLCWRLAHESYGEFPFVKKLIGSGPETFGIIMKQEHYQEMVQGCGQVFDSPHNEFIQYLFCTGALGAACYYAFLASCLWKGIHGDAVKKTAAIAAITYTAVSFVNISVPITQPYLIMLAAWCSTQKKEEGGEKHMLTYPFEKACKEIFGESGEPVYRRGQVYRVRQSQVTGSEQEGGRPAVIVSNDIGNDHSTVVEVVYLTTQKKTGLPTHTPINSVKYPSTALCEQIQTVCKDRLGKYIGTVTAQEMEGINEAMLISLGLKKPHRK